MGNNCSTSGKKNSSKTDDVISEKEKENKRRKSQELNFHNANPEIKIHTTVTGELDDNHTMAMKLPLGEVTDEQLLAEVARRKLDLQDNITDAFVKESYEFGNILGHGASGSVYMVSHKQTQKKYACKVVKKDSSMNDASSMSTEIEIMKRIRHRHIVSMYELYETPKCLWMILELIQGGDLNYYLAKQPKYTEKCAARHMKQILQGIHYLHSRGVVHRDLKMDNILLSNDNADADVKIADFGLSALCRIGEGYDPDESIKRKKYTELTQVWGTREYFSPELINEAYGPQSDMWSAGCIMYEILVGYQAFPILEGDTDNSFYGRIFSGSYDMSRPVWKDVSEEAKSLLKMMLKVNPSERYSASEALTHPWITGACWTSAHDNHLAFAHNYFIKKLQARENRKRADRNNLASNNK